MISISILLIEPVPRLSSNEFLVQVVIQQYLQEIEDAIRNRLLPAITGQPFIDDTLRNIMTLPARLGGLGIENPVVMADLEHANSVAVTSKLCDAILEQKMEYKPEPEEQREVLASIKKIKNDLLKSMAENIKQKLSPKEQRNLDWISEKGASSFLTCLPLGKLRFHLTRQEFHDAISVRYNMPIVGDPRPEICCCGDKNTIEHALSCKKGGYVSLRNNCIRDYIAGELDSICYNTQIEPRLLSTNGRDLPEGTITDDHARLDISTRDFWTTMDKAFFDVRVLNSQAPSNANQSIPQTFLKHEKEKKTAYLHRVLEVDGGVFTPLVMATTGGLGREFARFVKHLAEEKSKSGNRYEDCIRYIRLRLSFAMVRSVTLSLRGYRGKLREDTTNDLYMMCVGV